MTLLNSCKIILRNLVYLLACIVVFCLVLSLFYSPVYRFREPKPFSGTNWYNPYKGLNGKDFHRGNFQVQSRSWGGLTNGEGNSALKIFNRYDSLGYGIITISDYMKINPFSHPGKPSINAYEHGYGIRKTHQLCLGSDKVNWLDYPLIQTRSNKQHILDLLSRHSKVLCIAHPSLRNAYTLEDMRYLEGYHLIESISHFAKSFDHWDAALSAGKPVFIIANDDAHNMDNPYDYGRVLTMVHATSMTEDSIYSSMALGHAYGYEVYTADDISVANKPQVFQKLATLQHCDVSGDTIKLITDRPIASVRFITQDGKIMNEINFNDQDVYEVSENISDVKTYVRAEITMKNRDVMYLNPIFRYTGNPLARQSAEANITATFFARFTGVFILFLPLVHIIRRYLYRILNLPQLTFPTA